MEKLYQRINYENSPSKKTPLSEANLNKMDKALDDLDNRNIEQDAKFTKSIEAEDKKIEDANGKISTLTDTAATLTQSKSDAITVEKSGTTIVATDSSDKGFEQFKIYGKSVQDKTSGNNTIFPFGETIDNTNGIKWSRRNGVVTLSGTCTATGGVINIGETRKALASGFYKYEFEGTISGNLAVQYNYANSICGVATKEEHGGIAFAIEEGKNIRLYLYEGLTINGTFKLMLSNVDLSDKSYEPYTGGQASPNPEYEQPIVSAGQMLAKGNQLWNGKYISDAYVETDTFSDGIRAGNNALSVEVGKQYTFSINGVPSQIRYVFLDANKSDIGSLNNASTVTTPTNAVYLRWRSIDAVKQSDKCMLNEGSTALPYEPYTAGVKKAVDVGIQKKLTGKNLLKNTATTQTINGVTFTVNEDGSVTINGTATVVTDFYIARPLYLNAGQYIINKYQESVKVYLWNNGFAQASTNGLRFTVDDGNGVNVFLRVEAGQTVSNINVCAMIRLAEIEDDTYEQYVEPQTLTLNRVLRGIPVTDSSLANYTDENGQMWCADYADVERKVWVQRVKEVSFDDATWNFNADYNIWTCGYSNDAIYQALVCESVPFNIIGTDGGELGTRINVPYNIWVRNGSTTESPKGKAQYILATPIETPMTDEEIAAYDALHTNKPNTIITNDAGCFMVVKYVADTKAHIEQNYVPASKYTALEDRVSALERLHV